MLEQLKNHVHSIFTPYQSVKSAQELEEELLQNLLDKYEDYKNQGLNDTEAYQQTVDSIGEVSELIDSIQLQQHELEKAVEMNYSRQLLKDADFRDVQLEHSKFHGSDIKGSDFTNADLSGSSFKGSNLERALFDEAKLVEATLSRCALRGASFLQTVLDHATFRGCDVTEANFDDNTLQWVVFEGSSLKRTTFRNAVLQQVQFRHCDARKANFDGAKMDKLTYNFLQGCGANLDHVELMKEVE